MKAFVVWESMYGNTAAVGEAIAASLAAQDVDVRAGPTSDVEPAAVSEADLLVVGGPTHAHGMSRAATRKAAVSDTMNAYPNPMVILGLREWIDAVPPGDRRLAAAFDTRIDKLILLTGSAARGIGRRLERHGFRLVAAPESFFVSSDNRLIEGELDHAQRWGSEIARAATVGAAW